MSCPQGIISHETNVFLENGSFYKHNQCGSGTYVSREVCSLPMSFTQDIFSLDLDLQDQIGICLENSFMNSYPWFSNEQIMFLVNKMPNKLLILSILNGKVI